MKKLVTSASALALAAGLAAVSLGTPATAAPPTDQPGRAFEYGHDNRPGPLAERREALMQEARERQIAGKVPFGAKKTKIGKGKRAQFVELAREKEDSIWTLLVEFGDEPATHDHGTLGTIDHGGDAGPRHNEIPEPDRRIDNSTIWKPDFSREYYLDLLFDDTEGANSMRNYYKEQSSGRYTVNGDVTEWEQVPHNAAAYGSNYCGDIVCSRDVQRLLEDGLAAWYQSQVDAGKTPAQIKSYLSAFDVWDRYDADGDGDFNESDGYIDHFQTVHAGEGEETGGGALGEDAIWSHRGYTNSGAIGTAGPEGAPFGGVQIGDTGYWIGDYTIEPENGGVGVFAHEFAHDLGLPDLYDTSGNTGGAENSTAFWTLMSSGSYGNTGKPRDGIGDHPTHMGAWEKLFLGWLDYETFEPGDRKTTYKLGPSEYNNTAGQATVVNLGEKEVTLELGAPYAGSRYFYSGSGDNLDNVMSKQVTLPAGSPTLTAKARYNIEQDWDYGYVVVSTDGGSSWETVETNLSTADDPNSQNFGGGITGSSEEWTDLSADLSEYAGQQVLVGFRYWTDGAVQGNSDSTVPPGLQLDDVTLPGQPVDGAETDTGWTFDGFSTTTGTETDSYPHYYILENKQYVGYDKGLRTGPYNFTNRAGKPNQVEHFPYQDGLLVWYWDSSQADNNVGDHPGEGLVLPVDARPEILTWSDGSVARPRIQSFDSTFGLQRTDRVELTQWVDGKPVRLRVPPQKAVRVFDDSRSYWTSGHPGDAPDNGRYQSEWSSVKVPSTGTVVRVVKQGKNGFMTIQVRQRQADSGS